MTSCHVVLLPLVHLAANCGDEKTEPRYQPQLQAASISSGSILGRKACLSPAEFHQSGALPSKHYAITHRQQTRLHPGVVTNFHIERAERFRVGAVRRGIGNSATPEYVVDGDYAARSQQLQTGFVIRVIVCLISINEGKIKRPGGAVAQELR
jgi:hypothetical protein